MTDLLCRLRMHRWSIATYPIGTRWCFRCGKRDHDPSAYNPVIIALARESRPLPPDDDCPDLWPTGEHLDPPTSCCTCVLPPGSGHNS